MTAFSTSQIPTTGTNAITTLEQLSVWTAMALAACNPTVTAIEGDGSAQKIAQVGQFFVPNNNSTRVISRTSIPITSDVDYNGKKLWASATEIGSTAIPTAFSS